MECWQLLTVLTPTQISTQFVIVLDENSRRITLTWIIKKITLTLWRTAPSTYHRPKCWPTDNQQATTCNRHKTDRLPTYNRQATDGWPTGHRQITDWLEAITRSFMVFTREWTSKTKLWLYFLTSFFQGVVFHNYLLLHPTEYGRSTCGRSKWTCSQLAWIVFLCLGNPSDR